MNCAHSPLFAVLESEIDQIDRHLRFLCERRDRVEAEIRTLAQHATSFEAHQADDPHCTCNDCMEDYSARVTNTPTRCAYCGAPDAEIRPNLVGDDPTCLDCARAIRRGAELDGSATCDCLLCCPN